MNCPSRTDEPLENDGWNQNPPRLAADLTTRQDMNGIVNLRTLRSSVSSISDDDLDRIRDDASNHPSPHRERGISMEDTKGNFAPKVNEVSIVPRSSSTLDRLEPVQSRKGKFLGYVNHAGRIMSKFGRFVGPGFMVSVAYIDPGNYSTDVAAGASTKFKLLFIVLMSNMFAILLQSLAVRLGTVTGLNLAEHCRAHLPRWLNLVLYVMGEGAIIATDIAEVSDERHDTIYA